MSEGFTFEMANLVAVWVEILLYGIYVCLFVQSMYIMASKARENITSVKVFFIATVLLFIIATCNVAINFYRLLRGYIWLRDTVGPEAYFGDFQRWDNTANDALLFIMTWIGDALVIYRCWIIWNYNYYVIILPAMLMTVSVGVNTASMYWFSHLDRISFARLMKLMSAIYPLAFAQNTLATGLIAYRIWTQHRASVRVGVHNTGSRMNLMYIVRIVVESAMVYTVQLLILIVLYTLQHNAQFVLQLAIVPSIGASRAILGHSR
ncbi:hypothetical protein BD779DRAFT_1069533 [Infundibulicybe gibba]|nr:hypothetical protein BD779DRAFT_1069533 [Infundibulicybe gibba]